MTKSGWAPAAFGSLPGGRSPLGVVASTSGLIEKAADALAASTSDSGRATTRATRTRAGTDRIESSSVTGYGRRSVAPEECPRARIANVGVPKSGSGPTACARLAALDVRLVSAEHVAHRAADLAHRGAVLQRLADRRQQVAVAACRLSQLLEPGVDELLVAVRLERLQPLDLLALGLGVDAQQVRHLERLVDVLVDADDDVLLLLVALLVAPGRLLDLVLDERDRVDRAAELVDLRDQLAGALLDLARERLDEVGAGERVDRVGRARLVADDLLRAQRDLRGALGRQRERLVVAVRVQRLRAAADGGEALQRDAHDVVLRLLGGQRHAAGLRVEAQLERALVLRAARNFATSWKTLLWPLKKNASRGAKSSTARPASTAACT